MVASNIQPKYLIIEERHGERPYEQNFKFIVDVEKLQEYASNEDNEFEYSYIKHIIKAGLEWEHTIYSSRKYSLSDAPEWYVSFLLQGLPPGTTEEQVHTLYVN